jgi:hypothetical protein
MATAFCVESSSFIGLGTGKALWKLLEGLGIAAILHAVTRPGRGGPHAAATGGPKRVSVT